jgi:hypothetical protein
MVLRSSPGWPRSRIGRSDGHGSACRSAYGSSRSGLCAVGEGLRLSLTVTHASGLSGYYSPWPARANKTEFGGLPIKSAVFIR